MKKRIAIAIAVLLAFGAIRLPLEIRLQAEQKKAGFHPIETLKLSLRQQLGQSSYVAALSGFRSLVAVVLWLETQDYWENLEWGRMAGTFDTVTTLQPKSPVYWDMSAWHMGYNASVAALDDEKRQPSKILRERDARAFWEKARKYYEDGIRNNPDSAVLWANLGHLERQKFQDHAAASKAFETASTKPNALPYLRRLAAYELAEVPGREKEAYARLKGLYDEGEKEHLPSLIAKLKQLEEKLGIPAAERIKESNAR